MVKTMQDSKREFVPCDIVNQKCQGFLLPCSRIIYGGTPHAGSMGILYHGTHAEEKYWKCSQCNREVR